MIYDADWNPVNDNEYHQRLLATTILLVRAAGGVITITPDMLQGHALTGHVLNQGVDSEGNIVLSVMTMPLPAANDARPPEPT